MRIALIPILFLFLFSSCEKDEVLTEAEKTQQELQDVITHQNVQRVYAFDYPGGGWSTLPASLGVGWTFSNGYITIYGYNTNQNRNLAYLYTYDVVNVPVDDGTTKKALM